MIKNIILFSIQNRLLVIIFFIFLLILAYQSMQNIPLDAIHDLSDTQVII